MIGLRLSKFGATPPHNYRMHPGKEKWVEPNRSVPITQPYLFRYYWNLVSCVLWVTESALMT